MTENTGFAAYALWNALKLHFTSDSYDYFKYNGKTNVSKQTFSIRKDKYQFYKLSRKYSLEELETMMPWEREIYIMMLVQYLEEENQRLKKRAGQG